MENLPPAGFPAYAGMKRPFTNNTPQKAKRLHNALKNIDNQVIIVYSAYAATFCPFQVIAGTAVPGVNILYADFPVQPHESYGQIIMVI